MGMFDFMFEDKTPKPAEKVEPQAQPSTPANPTTVQTVAATPPSAVAITVDTEAVNQFRDMLLGKIQTTSSDLSCFPFMESLNGLEATITDERTRYNVAFMSGKAFGITPVKIIDACGACKNALSAEESNFKRSSDAEVQNCITSKEQQIENLDNAIADRNKRIQDLVTEINTMNEQKTAISAEISNDKIRIETVKRNFYTAYQGILNSFDALIQKIQLYTGGTK